MTIRPTPTRAPTPPAPVRSLDFAHFDLVALRSYRRALIEEESRVSYWRRILHARLDVLGSRTTSVVNGNDKSLQHLLAAEQIDEGRKALLTMLPLEGIPPLPELNQLWAENPAPGDEEHTSRLLEDLSKAERQLSAYRSALHRRLSVATGELIARYRESPKDCLSALPQVPAQAGPPSES